MTNSFGPLLRFRHDYPDQIDIRMDKWYSGMLDRTLGDRKQPPSFTSIVTCMILPHDKGICMKKPAYQQIFDSLLEQIEDGLFQPGSKLPSERALSRQLGVSRMTVRQALNALVQQGLAYRIQGSGTYVAEPKIEHHVDTLTSFSVSMSAHGLTPATKLLSIEKIRANKIFSEVLGLNVGQMIWHIHRLRIDREIPIGLEYSYFPLNLVPDLDQHDLEQRSIYEILETEYQIQISSALQSFEPVVSNEYEQGLLNVPLGSPLMMVSRISYDAENVAVEHGKDIYRGDKTRFVAKSVRHIAETSQMPALPA